jgi:uncharacterized membrane protein
MKQLQKIFLQGLVTFLPIAVTIYLVWAGVRIVDSLFGSALSELLPVYIPGLGFLMTIVLIFILGFLLNNLITAGLLQSLERKLTQVPFIKAIYSPLRDLMNLFNKSGTGDLKTAALVELSDGVKALGLVTRESFHDLPHLKDETADKVTVYIPLSYSLGGFTVLVSRSKITPLDMPTEKAMSLAITGWVKAEEPERRHV